MLNDDGQIEGETHPENHPTTTVSGQVLSLILEHAERMDR